jgi:hypothetical protein
MAHIVIMTVVLVILGDFGNSKQVINYFKM